MKKLFIMTFMIWLSSFSLSHANTYWHVEFEKVAKNIYYVNIDYEYIYIKTTYCNYFENGDTGKAILEKSDKYFTKGFIHFDNVKCTIVDFSVDIE